MFHTKEQLEQTKEHLFQKNISEGQYIDCLNGPRTSNQQLKQKKTHILKTALFKKRVLNMSKRRPK